MDFVLSLVTVAFVGIAYAQQKYIQKLWKRTLRAESKNCAMYSTYSANCRRCGADLDLWVAEDKSILH
jgi:hypothetical protein